MPRAVNAAVLLLSLAGRAEEFPGAAVHRLYAARMLEEPSCAEFVRAPKWDYPFAANVSDERAALALANRTRVWATRAGSGLGNSLLGFGQAFAQGLLDGQAVVVGAWGTNTALCCLFRCGFASVRSQADAKAARAVVRRPSGVAAKTNACLLAVSRCADGGCFAGRAIQVRAGVGAEYTRLRARRSRTGRENRPENQFPSSPLSPRARALALTSCC